MKKAGFLLIEAIVALSVLMVFLGVFAFARSQMYAMKSEALQYLQGQNYATDYIEKIHGGVVNIGQKMIHKPFVITSKKIPTPIADTFKNVPFDLIEVAVTWKTNSGHARNITLFTGKVL